MGEHGVLRMVVEEIISWEDLAFVIDGDWAAILSSPSP